MYIMTEIFNKAILFAFILFCFHKSCLHKIIFRLLLCFYVQATDLVMHIRIISHISLQYRITYYFRLYFSKLAIVWFIKRGSLFLTVCRIQFSHLRRVFNFFV